MLPKIHSEKDKKPKYHSLEKKINKWKKNKKLEGKKEEEKPIPRNSSPYTCLADLCNKNIIGQMEDLKFTLQEDATLDKFENFKNLINGDLEKCSNMEKMEEAKKKEIAYTPESELLYNSFRIY